MADGPPKPAPVQFAPAWAKNARGYNSPKAATSTRPVYTEAELLMAHTETPNLPAGCDPVAGLLTAASLMPVLKQPFDAKEAQMLWKSGRMKAMGASWKFSRDSDDARNAAPRGLSSFASDRDSPFGSARSRWSRDPSRDAAGLPDPRKAAGLGAQPWTAGDSSGDAPRMQGSDRLAGLTGDGKSKDLKSLGRKWTRGMRVPVSVSRENPYQARDGSGVARENSWNNKAFESRERENSWSRGGGGGGVGGGMDGMKLLGNERWQRGGGDKAGLRGQADTVAGGGRTWQRGMQAPLRTSRDLGGGSGDWVATRDSGMGVNMNVDDALEQMAAKTQEFEAMKRAAREAMGLPPSDSALQAQQPPEQPPQQPPRAPVPQQNAWGQAPAVQATANGAIDSASATQSTGGSAFGGQVFSTSPTLQPRTRAPATSPSQQSWLAPPVPAPMMAPAPVALRDENVKEWTYKDPQGQLQGPFTMLQMRGWYQRGYFQPDLPVQCGGNNNAFISLGVWFPDREIAFTPNAVAQYMRSQQPQTGQHLPSTLKLMFQQASLSQQPRQSPQQQPRQQKQATPIAAPGPAAPAASVWAAPEGNRVRTSGASFTGIQASEAVMPQQEQRQQLSPAMLPSPAPRIPTTPPRSPPRSPEEARAVSFLQNQARENAAMHAASVVHRGGPPTAATTNPRQMQQQQPTRTPPLAVEPGPSVWAAPKSTAAVPPARSLAEIQAEEAIQMRAREAARAKAIANGEARPAGAWGAVPNSAPTNLVSIQRAEARAAQARPPQQQPGSWARTAGGGSQTTSPNWPTAPPSPEAQAMTSDLKAMLGVKQRGAPVPQQSGAQLGVWGNSGTKKTTPKKTSGSSLLDIQAEEAQKQRQQHAAGVRAGPSGWAAVASSGGGGAETRRSAPPARQSAPPPVSLPMPQHQQAYQMSNVPPADSMFWEPVNPANVGNSKIRSSSSGIRASAAAAAQHRSHHAGNNATTFGGSGMPPDFQRWCAQQLKAIKGDPDTTLCDFCYTVQSSADIREYLRNYLGSTPAVSKFSSDFIQKKEYFQRMKRSNKKKGRRGGKKR